MVRCGAGRRLLAPRRGTPAPPKVIAEGDMSQESTAHNKHDDVDPFEESSAVPFNRRRRPPPRTSNMRIRTATGRANPRPSDREEERAADDGGSAEFRAALDSPTGGRRHHGTSSTTQVDDGQE